MQIYGIKLNYFFRFGDKNNSLVFDVAGEDAQALNDGKITLDALYEKLSKDPTAYINKVKDEKAITNLLSIVGMRDGNVDASNGMGKSTVLEGICYALYDKVVRKHVYTTKEGNAGVSVATRINNKFHPKMKESFVEIIFEDNGKLYRLKRGRKFSKNQKSNSPVLELESYNDDGTTNSLHGHTIGRTTEESLKKVITMDYDIFVNGLMFGQGDAGKYLFGTDKVKKDMLINILNLDALVVGQLEAIRKKKNAADKEVAIFDAQIQAYKDKLKQHQSPKTIRGLIDECEKNIVSLEEQIKDFDKQIEKLLSSDIMKNIEQINVKIEEIEQSKENAEKSFNDKSKSVKALLAKISEDGKRLSSRVPEIDKKIQDIDVKISNLKKAVDEFDQDEYTKNLSKVAKAKKVKPKLEKEHEQKNQALIVAHTDIGKHESDTQRYQKELDKFQKHLEDGEDFECGYCKSTVSVSHIQEHIDKSKKGLAESSKARDTKMAEANEERKAVSDLESKLSRASYIINMEESIKQTLTIYKRDQESLESGIASKKDLVKEKADAEKRLQELREEKGKYQEQLNEFDEEHQKQVMVINQKSVDEKAKLENLKEQSKGIVDEIRKLKLGKGECDKKLTGEKQKLGGLNTSLKNSQAELKTYKKLLKEVEEKRKEHSRWLILEDVHGLDGIQTRIIRKYLPLLNSYIKGYLDILTDGEMTVDMAINDKSKIDMVITGGSSDTFEMLSGGEKMLVRLAVDISLALLSFVRSPQEPELICLDEIFGQLDDKNTGAVFRLLNALSTEFSRVVLISHKPYINDKISNKVYVNKQSGTYGMSEFMKIDV